MAYAPGWQGHERPGDACAKHFFAPAFSVILGYMRRILSLSMVLSAVVFAPPAAALQQPDNTTIPVGSSLQDLFTSRGEGINALADAAITPQTFVPSCGLTFTVLQRNAGYKNSFGWYNVTGSKPSVGELHEFLSCNDPVGFTKVLDIKNDPAYAGGEIGFYEATGGCATLQSHDYIFFSEPQYNPDGNQQNPFIHLLIYNSTVTPKAFYFGWEDLLSGGDNDFDDLTTFVTGISCSGGGVPCNTGQPGICADGVMQCQSGMLTCVQSNQPGTETCNGLDDDCNAATDEGDICPANQVCDKGTCVPKCAGGEFDCSVGEVCNENGYCVDPACVAVTCPEGQKCIKGECKGPCDGVVCPHGQTCRVGACVDPCTSITCDSEQVCVAGVCVEKCQCAGCGASESCQADGRCLLSVCEGKSCGPGQYCDANGNCADSCGGAVCPSGQVCEQGQCVAQMGGTGGAGGGIFPGTGGSAGSGTGGASSGAGGAGGGANGGSASESGSCGCRMVGRDNEALGALAALLACGLAARKRRAKKG
jgi:hypothetical protein